MSLIAAATLAAGVLGVASPAFATGAPGPATQLVATVPGDFTAGVAQSVTIYAEDANGNVDTSYNGSVSALFSQGDFYPNGAWVTLSGGTGTVLVGTDHAGAQQLEPFSFSGPAGVYLPVVVDPGPIASIQVVAPTLVSSGQDFTYTVRQLDSFGNLTSGAHIEVDLWDPDTSLTSQLTTTSAPLTTQFHSVGQAHINAVDTDNYGLQSLHPLNVSPPVTATHIEVAFDQSPVAVGQSGNLTFSAVDDDGDVQTIPDVLQISDGDPTAVINAGVSTISLVNGTATVPATFFTVGNEEVDAATAGLTGNTVLPVVAGDVTALTVAGPATVAVGQPYTLTVTPVDTYGNQSFEARYPAQVTWSANADPADPTTVGYANGVAVITGTFTTVGAGAIDIAGQYPWDLTAEATVTVTPAVVSSPVVPPVNQVDSDRVAGTDRFGTATAISVKEFPAGGAGAVVLARSDDAADSTVGTVLAAAKNAPLLFTDGSSLPAATAAEISRVLPAGGTVYLLGGTAAVPASVASQLSTDGFTVVRLAGADRYGTAVAVADAVGGNGPVFLATGTDFADALAAGPAAAHGAGTVLLTDGGSLPPSVVAFLAAHTGPVFAIGGQAAAADSSATAVMGADRYGTAAAVAAKFFTAPANVGVASGVTFADALSGAAYLAHLGGPLLLTAPDSLSAPTGAYLAGATASTTAAFTFGGTSAISASTQTQIDGALGTS